MIASANTCSTCAAPDIQRAAVDGDRTAGTDGAADTGITYVRIRDRQSSAATFLTPDGQAVSLVDRNAFGQGQGHAVAQDKIDLSADHKTAVAFDIIRQRIPLGIQSIFGDLIKRYVLTADQVVSICVCIVQRLIKHRRYRHIAGRHNECVVIYRHCSAVSLHNGNGRQHAVFSGPGIKGNGILFVGFRCIFTLCRNCRNGAQ